MSIPSVFWGIKNVCFICVDFFVPYVSKFLSGNTAPHKRRIFMRQLSRSDKSGNSRFEYTKILNTAHAGTLSGFTPLRTKCFICVQFSRPKKLTEYLNVICVNFIFDTYAPNFHATIVARYRRVPYDAKVKVLIKSAKAVILNLFG